VTGDSPADTLRPFIYGDAPIEEWSHDADTAESGPWGSFDRARGYIQSGRMDEAVAEWSHITSMPGIEARQTLQAWHFLRGAGVQVPEDQAKIVLGVVAEMPVQAGHDVLGGYLDGSVRYLNHSGKVVVIEDRTIIGTQRALRAWLELAQGMVGAIGSWEQPTLPPLPAQHGRIVMLTPSGPHFGQAPIDALSGDPFAAGFLGAATGLLQEVLATAS
jgi:hypothetical protein